MGDKCQSLENKNIDLWKIMMEVENAINSWTLKSDLLKIGTEEFVLITTEKKGMGILARKLSSLAIPSQILPRGIIVSYDKRKNVFSLIKGNEYGNSKKTSENLEDLLIQAQLKNPSIIIFVDTIHTGSELRKLFKNLPRKMLESSTIHVISVFGNSRTKKVWEQLCNEFNLLQDSLHLIYEIETTNVLIDFLIKFVIFYPPSWIDRRKRTILEVFPENHGNSQVVSKNEIESLLDEYFRDNKIKAKKLDSTPIRPTMSFTNIQTTDISVLNRINEFQTAYLLETCEVVLFVNLISSKSRDGSARSKILVDYDIVKDVFNDWNEVDNLIEKCYCLTNDLTSYLYRKLNNRGNKVQKKVISYDLVHDL